MFSTAAVLQTEPQQISRLPPRTNQTLEPQVPCPPIPGAGRRTPCVSDNLPRALCMVPTSGIRWAVWAQGHRSVVRGGSLVGEALSFSFWGRELRHGGHRVQELEKSWYRNNECPFLAEVPVPSLHISILVWNLSPCFFFIVIAIAF